MRRVGWLFGIAGVYGLGATLPLYLRPLAADTLFLWTFAGAAAATQLLYLLIATDPARYRPAVPVGIASKLSFAAPVLWLYAHGGTSAATAVFALIDLILAAAFAWAWRDIGRSPGRP